MGVWSNESAWSAFEQAYGSDNSTNSFGSGSVSSPSSSSGAGGIRRIGTSEEISRMIGFYLLPPVCLVGFVLNLVNVAVLTRKTFNGVAYTFMVAIAIADSITLLTTAFIAYARCTDDCPVTSVLRLYYDIYVYLPVSNTVEGFSSLITVSLAIERYLSMVKYFWMRQHSTRRKVFAYVSIITLLSILMGLPYAFIQQVDPTTRKKLQTQLFTSVFYFVFSFVRPLVMVVAPLALLVIFNGLLIRVTFVQRSRRNVRLKSISCQSGTIASSHHLTINSKVLGRTEESTLIEAPNDARHCENGHGNGNGSGNGSSNGVGENSVSGNTSVIGITRGGKSEKEKRSARDKAERRLTVMSICIILLFVIGHTPVMFAYAIIWSRFGGSLGSPAHVAFTRFTQLLLMISASSSFFMYLHFNKHFKAVLACRHAAKNSLGSMSRTEANGRCTHH